jgi:hypothetical protein
MPIHDWTRVDAGTFHSFALGWVAKISSELNQGLLHDEFYSQTEHQEEWIADKFLLGEHLAQFKDQVEADREFYTLKRRSIMIRKSVDDEVEARIEIVSPGLKADARKLEEFIHKATSDLAAGRHLLLIDLFPSTVQSSHQLHEHIGKVVDKNIVNPVQHAPLVVASFRAGETIEKYLEPAAVGANLKPMPLFLRKELFVTVPLETTYDAAFAGMPERWQRVLTNGA